MKPFHKNQYAFSTYSRAGNLIWAPFGVILPNGVTFRKSVEDKNSSLVKVLRYLSTYPFTTKDTLCRGVLGFHIRKHRWGHTKFRGWRAAWFSGIKRAGFVQVTKGKNGRYLYSLTPLGQSIVEYHFPRK